MKRIEQLIETAWKAQCEEWPASSMLPSYVAQKFGEKVARAVLDEAERWCSREVKSSGGYEWAGAMLDADHLRDHLRALFAPAEKEKQG